MGGPILDLEGSSLGMGSPIIAVIIMLRIVIYRNSDNKTLDFGCSNLEGPILDLGGLHLDVYDGVSFWTLSVPSWECPILDLEITP